MNTEPQLTPTDAKIINEPTEGDSLFMVFWERIANSGSYLIWAANEQDVAAYCYPETTSRASSSRLIPKICPYSSGWQHEEPRSYLQQERTTDRLERRDVQRPRGIPMKAVLIEVRNGKATITSNPANIAVMIIDHDNKAKA